MNKKLKNEELPLISVVIPMYNREKTIKKCVNSVLIQNYQNIEILVVDDASSDNSLAILNTIKSSQLQVIVSEQKIYAQGARNLGVKNAKGDWIIFLDSDDELTFDSIFKRYETIKRFPDVDFIYGDTMYCTDIIRYKNLNNMTQKEIRKYIFKELCLCAFSEIMVKKSCIEEIGYLDEKYKAWQDDSLVVSLINKGFILKHSESIVSIHFSTDNQISSNFNNLLQGISRMMNIYKKEIIETNGYSRYFLWKLRVFLDYLKTKKDTKCKCKIENVLKKILLEKFEHIWG